MAMAELASDSMLALPLPSMQCISCAFDDQRSGIICSHVDIMNRPARHLSYIFPARQQSCFIAYRYIKDMKRQRQPHSTRFDIGLLARPTAKKSLLFCWSGKFLKLRLLS